MGLNLKGQSRSFDKQTKVRVHQNILQQTHLVEGGEEFECSTTFVFFTIIGYETNVNSRSANSGSVLFVLYVKLKTSFGDTRWSRNRR